MLDMSFGTIIVIVIITIAGITILIPLSLVGKTIWNSKKNLFQREGVKEPLNYFANNKGPLDNPPTIVSKNSSEKFSSQPKSTQIITPEQKPMTTNSLEESDKNTNFGAIEPNLDNSFKSKSNPNMQPKMTKENINLHYHHDSDALIESNKIKAIPQPKPKKYKVKTKKYPLHNRLAWWKFDDMETGKNEGVDDVNLDFSNKKIDDYQLNDFQFTKFDNVKGSSIKDNESIKTIKPKRVKKNRIKKLKVQILQHHPTEQPMEDMNKINSIKDISNQEMIKINLISKIIKNAINNRPKRAAVKKHAKKVVKTTKKATKKQVEKLSLVKKPKLVNKKPKITITKSKPTAKKTKPTSKKLKRTPKKVSIPGSKGKKVF
ncbi:hypothetical protein ASO20_02935 [Mycoplasma sp. (ex Biomphalaria glabrata)]|uniref:hypothetical protein n=1 Tax=Mycoplasma sp. (ex Biomphalaria glabrata) TaxID=1749074 RepID=UPI00073A82F3|nr:hypothetical protein [Mycoplasma sp. (ex Biomphalaria glabrata)]ALV23589.1 hypothetical protein ASO20_02935 [Mycoplasma sp. (ex Biomphalaria glabrata)]